MQSRVLQIPPVVASWIKQLQLGVPLNYLKHDFSSGYAVGLMLNKVYGSAYETRTLDNNTSTACAQHNWGRILELKELNGGKFALDAQIVKRVIEKDEKSVLDLLISIYQDATGNTVPKIVYPVIPRESKPLKSPPATLKATGGISLLPRSPERVAAQGAEKSYPANVPMFARGCYENSRALIEHLNRVCEDSIRQFDVLHEFLEMLDPRADFCYPYAQLLLRLPKQYAFRVCQGLAERVDVQLVASCIANDYMLFYDFASILLQAGVALNQVCAGATELFDSITNILCRVVEEIKRQSQDAMYIIYQNIIMSRLIKEIPLINFSLTHFFRICLASVSSFTQATFNKILAAMILNIKNTCPLYSENRLRLEVLLAFAMYAQQYQQHKEEIARACIKHTLHSILLPNQEKFLAIDLFVRCVHLCPKLFVECEFALLRLLGFLVNKSKRRDIEDVLSDATQEKPLIIECHEFEFEFWFNDIGALNYEQVLFLVLAMQKLLVIPDIENRVSNVRKVHERFLAVLVLGRGGVPACFYYIGVLGMVSLAAERIAAARTRICTIMASNDVLNAKIAACNAYMESAGLSSLVSSITAFLRANFQQMNALFSIVDGSTREIDMIHSLAHVNRFATDVLIQNDVLDDIQTQLADFFFDKTVKTLYKNTHASDLVILVTYAYIQSFEASAQELRMLICLLAMQSEMCSYAFQALHDELFTSVLAEDEQISIAASDCLLCILLRADQNLIHEETRSSLHALVDFCFNYNGKELTDTLSRKNIQVKCLRFLDQMEAMPQFGSLLLELVEKLDFDDFGNDQLAQFIGAVRGEM